MPKQYEDIKASELKRGVNLKDAKRIAAATFNKLRGPGVKPVTGKLPSEAGPKL